MRTALQRPLARAVATGFFVAALGVVILWTGRPFHMRYVLAPLVIATGVGVGAYFRERGRSAEVTRDGDAP